MDKIRIGLIGAGGNTRLRHIPGFQAIEGVEIVSVANRTPESSRRVAGEFGIPKVAASPEEVLADPDVDAVCIGTWPYKHRDYTVAALDAGKHVLCEARMAMDAREAEEMLAAAQAHPELVAQLVPAPFDFRLGPTIVRMINEGTLGTIHEVTVQVLNGGGIDPSAPAHWRHRIDLSGHNTMMMGIFNEMVQRWLGDTTRVIAHARIFVPERPDAENGRPIRVEIPDSLGIFADLACGARATYHVSSMTSAAPYTGVVLFGSRATLRWKLNDTATWAVHGEEFRELEPDPGTDRGWRVEADFIDSIRHGAPVRLTNFRDGVKYMRFTDAVWTSWNEGRAVDIPPLH